MQELFNKETILQSLCSMEFQGEEKVLEFVLAKAEQHLMVNPSFLVRDGVLVGEGAEWGHGEVGGGGGDQSRL